MANTYIYIYIYIYIYTQYIKCIYMCIFSVQSVDADYNIWLPDARETTMKDRRACNILRICISTLKMNKSPQHVASSLVVYSHVETAIRYSFSYETFQRFAMTFGLPTARETAIE